MHLYAGRFWWKECCRELLAVVQPSLHSTGSLKWQLYTMFRRQACSPGPMEVSIGWRAGLCFYRCCWGGGEAAWLRESLLKVRKFISRGSGGSEKAPLVPGHPGCFSREWILSCSRSAVSFHMPPCPYRNQKGAGSAPPL